MKFTRLIILFVSLISIGMAGRAAAQQTVTLNTLKIQLWPEYDRESMLVQYTGVVNNPGSEVTLTFTLPESASLHVTAYVDAGSGGFVQVGNVVDGNMVKMFSPNGSFHIEFYDTALDTSSAARTYKFTWLGDYAVDELSYSIQIPPGASEVSITPDAGDPTVASDGLRYYTIKQSGLAQGEASTIELAYQKGNADLTADVQSAQSTSEPAAASNSGTKTALMLIGAMVLVGIVSVGGWYWYQQRQKAEARVSKRKTRKQEGKVDTPVASTDLPPKFCTNCGAPIQNVNDRFCRNCGKPLKTALKT